MENKLIMHSYAETESEIMRNIDEVIEAVLELDAKATKGPWSHAKDIPNDEANETNNLALVEHYRTSAPKLAKALRVAMDLVNHCDDDSDTGDARFARQLKKQITAVLNGGGDVE